MQTRPTFPSLHDPKEHYPGETYISRRRTQYDFNFLAPSAECVALAEYSFAVGCERGGQIVHVETWSPSRRDGILTCPNGNRSMFHHATHLTFSWVNNPLIDNVGNPTWKPGAVIEPKLSNGHTPTLADSPIGSYMEKSVLEELARPVTSNFADRRDHYRHFHVGCEQWGTARLVPRPDFIIDNYPLDAVYVALPPVEWLDRVLAVEDTESSPDVLAFCDELGILTPAQSEYLEAALAEVTELRREHPDADDDHPMFWTPFVSAEKLAEAKRHYARRLAAEEASRRAERRKTGRRVLGRKVLENLDPWSFPGDERASQLRDGVPPSDSPRRRPPDRLGRLDYDAEAVQDFVGPRGWINRRREISKQFCRRHRSDLNSWRNGRNFGQTFPYGTVRQRIHANVIVRDGP